MLPTLTTLLRVSCAFGDCTPSAIPQLRADSKSPNPPAQNTISLLPNRTITTPALQRISSSPRNHLQTSKPKVPSRQTILPSSSCSIKSPWSTNSHITVIHNHIRDARACLLRYTATFVHPSGCVRMFDVPIYGVLIVPVALP